MRIWPPLLLVLFTATLVWWPTPSSLPVAESNLAQPTTSLHSEAVTDFSVEREHVPIETVDSLERDKNMVRVEVLNAKSLEPVLGAQVFVSADNLLVHSWQRQRYGKRPKLSEETLHNGEGVPTDSLGVAWIPKPSANSLVVVWNGAFAGRAAATGKDDHFTILLHHDPPIEIVAKRMDGSPLTNTEVGLFSGSRSGSPKLTTTTDHQGRAVLLAPRLHFMKEPTGLYRIGMTNLVPAEVKSVPFSQLPHTVEIVEEPSSFIRLQLQDPNGDPYLASGKVRVLLDRGQYQRSIPIAPGSGELLLPPLPLGRTIRLFLDFEGAHFKDLELNLQSPARAGEVVKEVVLVPMISHEYKIQVSRPNDLDELPPKALVRLKHASEDKQRESKAEMVLDKNGRGSVYLGISPKHLNEAMLIEVDVRPASPGPYRFGFSKPFQVPFLETVSIELDRPFPLVLGSVRDLEGHALEGASVGIYRRHSATRVSSTSYQKAETKHDGAYTIRSHNLPEQGVVKVFYQGRKVASQEFDAGLSTYDFEVARNPFILKGTVTLPSTLHDGVTLRMDQNGVETEVNLKAPVVGQSFRLELLSDEPGQLYLSRYPMGDFAILDDVQPSLPGQQGDQKLAHWDLRDALPLASVDVRIGARSIREYSIDRTGVDPRSWGRMSDTMYHAENNLRVRTAEGNQFLLIDGNSTRVMLSGPELSPMEIELRPGHQIIQAVPGAKGMLTIRGIESIPEGVDIVCFASPVNENSRDLRIAKAIPKDLRLSKWFQEPGPWTLSLVLYPKNNWGGCFPSFRRQDLELNGGVQDLEFTVTQGMGDFDLEIEIDAAVVAAFAKSLP